ncbi:hypothetical protein Avbf_17770 [Armadillidium vulgare]|nr:hypothetical protein Avbf_17770 [Armadillidium vulgare]
MKMKRGKFYPSKFSKICSDHFTPDCINPGVDLGNLLKPNAIHIFNFHHHHRLKKRKEQEYFETERKVPFSETGSGVKQPSRSEHPIL